MRFLVLFILFLSLTAFARMADDIEYFIKAGAEIPQILSAKNLSEYHFVFVGGYLNETVRGQYMTPNAEVLIKMGADVTVLFPSTLISVNSNQEMLTRKFKEIHERTGKPLIIIGHSKGGLEVLAALIAHPELVLSKKVLMAGIIQSPILGNAFIDRQGIAGRMISGSLGISPGHHSLNTEEIRKVISDRLDALPSNARAALSRAVKYVVSYDQPREFSRALRVANFMLGIDIPYDGLVAKHDMWLDGFGTVIGDIKADHLEYVIGKELLLGEKFDPRKVEAFTMSVLLNMFLSRNTRISEYRELTQALTQHRQQNPLCERKIIGIF